ncbi:hypothetical protein C0993_000355 [Termitomyces sp. T159_Od127]|nr:hypothetical protein C0993_000355 [Termitomyces sp. T159_Od127]
MFQKPRPSWSSSTTGQIISTWDFVSRLRSITVGAKRIFRYCDNIYDVLEKLILIRDLDPADFFDGHLVFRNLTTKEYVRGDAIKKVPNIPDMSWRRPLRLEFEHVLYIRTTWSSNPSLGYRYDGPLQIHRGVWAGHRFDVTRIGRVVDEAGVAVDDWKDVTEEVLNEVVEIWERFVYMGQFFGLQNLDHTIGVSTSANGKFGEFYFRPMSAGTQLLRVLWNPDKDEKRVVVLPLDQAEGFLFPQESNESLSKGVLDQLSNEVLDMIYGQISDILDLISLMVTCQRYWEFGRRHLERVIEDSIVVSWDGDRLIFLGGNTTELEDLPQGMLTDSEVENIRSYSDEYGLSLEDALPIIQTRCRKLSSTTMDCMRPISSTSDFVSQFHLSSYDSETGLFRYGREIYKILEKLILIKDLDPADFFDGHMVFRNLTTKEYVRGDGITKAWDIPDKPWLKKMRFEHVLYIRTTWSSDPTLSCLYDGPLQIHQGIWAGHRFDVTRIGRVVDEAGVAVDGWKDVTKEVINEVMEIWEPEGLA